MTAFVLILALTPKTLTGHAGTLVDGVAYVAGGMGWVNEGHFYPELWKVDLASGRWTELPGPNKARGMAAMASLPGKLALAGGLDWGSGPLASAESFDLATKKWTNLPPMHTARSRFALVECGGKLYALGGLGTTDNLDSIERYDPAKKSWTEAGRLLHARHGLAAISFGGNIYSFGGYGPDECADAEVFDPASGKSRKVKPMATARGFFSAVPWKDGILITGGRQAEHRPALFSPTKDSWTNLVTPAFDLNRFVAFAWSGSLWTIGGEAKEVPPVLQKHAVR